ncbi:hypothetical protein J6590_015590 [Homalodisca vitripennis]|nr:hypothetical protein J6590_015590 [Homalodisca vitripennis]
MQTVLPPSPVSETMRGEVKSRERGRGHGDRQIQEVRCLAVCNKECTAWRLQWGLPPTPLLSLFFRLQCSPEEPPVTRSSACLSVSTYSPGNMEKRRVVDVDGVAPLCSALRILINQACQPSRDSIWSVYKNVIRILILATSLLEMLQLEILPRVYKVD